MKKVTLLLAGVLFSALTIAQPLSNHLYLGGSIGFSSTSSTNDRADPDIETTSANFDFLLNMASVNIGISYLLML